MVRMTGVRLDTSTLGIAAIALGVFMLLALRLWASPITLAATGRDSVSLLSFLGIPVFIALVGIGIVLFVWGGDLTSR